MTRVVVVGPSGSGKTTLARRLAAKLDCRHVELDALNWDPDWTEAPQPVFRRRVAAALPSAGWVVDGNYSRVRGLVWGSADTLVCLDYPFFTVFARSLRRTLRRAFTKEPLWNGNRETFRRPRQGGGLAEASPRYAIAPRSCSSCFRHSPA